MTGLVMTATRPYIVFDRVDVSYSDIVTGLRSVSLSVDKGELVFLCGQTGSGKSTLLKVLTKQVAITSGQVLLDGRDVSQIRPKEIPFLRRQMGIVPQDFGLLPNKKVWENVGYAMRAIGKSRTAVRREVPPILEQVNILHRADAYPRELSGGEQQRVAIARALINNPPLLLADEPTANLDPSHSFEIMSVLQQLNDKGTTVVVCTHDMPVVERYGTRVIRLEFGRVAFDSRDGLGGHNLLLGPPPESLFTSDPAEDPVASEPAPPEKAREKAKDQEGELPSDV
jgi:cell division transport system ATP-binding protein